MLAANGRESDAPWFKYFLGEKLGKTLDEIDNLTYPEFIGWAAYFEVKAAMEGGTRG